MPTTVSGTLNDDIIIPTAPDGDYRGGKGNDTYILTSFIPATATITINDTEGVNRIQLVDGLKIASTAYAGDAVQLTLNNGAKVIVTGASTFRFDIGQNATAGDAPLYGDKSFADFKAIIGTGPFEVVNTAPIISTVSTLSATEDVSSAPFAVSTKDVEGNAVTVTATAGKGTVVDNKDGTFIYKGIQDFNGSDTITVTATDSLGAVSTKSIAVTVAAVNDAPVIKADATLAATEETAAKFNVSVSDVDGDTVTLTATAGKGTVVDNKDGSFTYTGSMDFAGTDAITLSANDGKVTTTQTITVTVANVNDAPVAVAATASGAEAGPAITGKLAATDVDAGDTLTYTLNAPVAGLTLNADGSYSFDPTKNATVTALKYSDPAAAVVANYTVKDAAGAASTSTLSSPSRQRR